MERTRIPLGTYRGLQFGLVTHPTFPPDVYLEGSTSRQATLARDHQGPRAVLNALERLANGYVAESDRVGKDLAIAEAQLRDYQIRLGKPFTLDAYLSELTALRDRLKAGLSATGHEPGKEQGPSVSELAERIKAMKAANSVEASPQRLGQKQSTAEEPITARIRRRREVIPASSDEFSVPGNGHGQEAASPQESSPSSTIPEVTFRERIALGRQGRPPQPSLR